MTRTEFQNILNDFRGTKDGEVAVDNALFAFDEGFHKYESYADNCFDEGGCVSSYWTVLEALCVMALNKKGSPSVRKALAYIRRKLD